MVLELNREQREILSHTMYRAAGKRYCGDSEDMQALVKAGYMKPCGTASWCPDPFFTITAEGRKALTQESTPTG